MASVKASLTGALLAACLCVGLVLGLVPAPSAWTVSSSDVAAQVAVIENGTAESRTLRFDTKGKAIDAHDGEIKQFGGIFYLYGTSYGCGYYRFSKRPTPFCGFRVYTSVDLVRWTDRGYLFNPRSGAWQARCNSLTLSCYRPHMLFNQRTGKYVLWVNAYDVPNGYHVLTSDSPTGPFTEVRLPVLSTTKGGDLDLFQDDNGVAYIATTLRPGYRLGIEELNRDYTSGTGRAIELPYKKVESPSLFKRGSRYYLTFSDPGCAYCAGTGTSYVTANSILGRWSARTTLHLKSCGGQPTDVAALTIGGRRQYLYQSDRWNRRNPNEALAGQHWELLGFDQAGRIRPLTCTARQAVPGLTTGRAPGAGGSQAAAWSAPASWTCNLKAGKAVSQTFKVQGPGRLTSIRTVLFRQRMYGKTLRVAVHRTKAGRPVGKAIWRANVPAGRLSWAPTTATFRMGVKVRRDATLALVLTGKGKRSTKGCFGFVTRQPVVVGAPGNSAQLRQRSSSSKRWKKRSGLMPIAATVS